jgi:hypothetical protein
VVAHSPTRRESSTPALPATAFSPGVSRIRSTVHVAFEIGALPAE